MWEDDLEEEEYERLNLDYDYPEYGYSSGSSKHFLKRNQHTERYINSYYDAVDSDSYND